MKRYLRGILTAAVAALLGILALTTTVLAEEETVYAIIPVSVTVAGQEGTLETDVPVEEYTLVLTALTETSLPEELSLTITGEGEGSFCLSYSRVGVYQYVIWQDSAALSGDSSTCQGRGEYDAAVYYVTVTVTNAEEGSGLTVVVSAHLGSPEGDKVAALAFENTYAPVPYDSLCVVKTWTDNDQLRPESITVQLLDGEEVVESIVLSSDNDWTYTWLYLDPYGSHDWSVSEAAVSGYSAEYTREGEVITIHNVGAIVETTQAQEETTEETTAAVDGPQTGEGAGLLLWSGLAALSAVLLGGLWFGVRGLRG